jgi:hypothetical protein
MSETAEAPILPEPKKPWFEPVCAILMAVASLATAWCSYQNSRWSDLSSSLENHADKLERQAVAQHLESGQIQEEQMMLWTEAMDAMIDGDEKLARFYTDRFSDEVKPAYETWIALNPLENAAAPPHPFVDDLYTPRFEREIIEARAEAGRAEAESNIAGNHAGSHLSNTVILAIVVFFAGTAGRFDRRSVRWSSLAFALALFAFVAVRMSLHPIQ